MAVREYDVTTGAETQREYTANELASFMAASIPLIPQSVTMRQARLALFQQGILSQVQTVINTMPDPQKTQAQISWDYSSIVERDNPVFIQLATALGLSSTQIDQLMTTAVTL